MSAVGRRVVVVGGGVIGTACAHFLSEAGWRVTILDRGAFGAGASHGNCGLVCPSHVLPLAEPGAVAATVKALLRPNSPFSIRLRLDPALLGWMLRFARRCNTRDMRQAAQGIQPLLTHSLRLYEQLFEQETLDCEWERRGLLYAYRSAAALEGYAATEALLRESFGLPGERLGPTELQQREPALQPTLAGGWYYEEDAHLRPDRLMSSWRQLLESRGVAICEHTPFVDFMPREGPVRGIVTAQGELPADACVVAAGALTPMLSGQLGVRVPIQPGKGYSLTMTRPGCCPTIPLIFPETRVAVTPFASGFRLGSTMEFAGYDARVDPRRIQLLRDGASPFLREPFGVEVEEEWAGWRPMTYDSLPIIDRTPSRANVVIAAGHNMLGLSMAPATGRLVADLLTDRKPAIDPHPYRVARFA